MIRHGSLFLLCVAVLASDVMSGCSGGGSGSGTGFGMARDEIAVGDGADSVRLSWSPSPSELPSSRSDAQLGYRIYHRVVPGTFEAVTVGSVNGVLVHGLDSGDHEFAVTSLTANGVESDPSERVQVSLP